MLYRSLYFIFHDEQTVRRVISKLEQELGIGDIQLHAIVKDGHTLSELLGATIHRRSEAAIRRENLYWNLSIIVFTLALIAMVLSLLTAPWYWTLLFGLLVFGAQLSGYLFGNRIPNAQLERFRTGLHKGDIVLQVDTPRQSIARIKAFIGEDYPDAGSNISNWHVGTIGL